MMMRDTRKLVTLAAAAVVVPALATPAQAQTTIECGPLSALPCDYGISALTLQPARSVLKLTARVSQAKLPTGVGAFRELLVFIKDGDTALCRESLADVSVSGGTLNIEIGRTMDCELDQVIAEHDALNFQLCIGSSEGCLPAIPLASVAYAVHSSFADLTGSAAKATVAAQANWTQRFAADPDLYLSQRLGKGFFDFRTTTELDGLFPAGTFASADDATDDGGDAAYQNGGFLQWTATDPDTSRLTLLAGDTSGNLNTLSNIALISNRTFTSGSLTVGAGGIAVANGDGQVLGDSTVAGLLKVNSLNQDFGDESALMVNGVSTINQLTVQFVGHEEILLENPDLWGLTVSSGGLNVIGTRPLNEGGDNYFSSSFAVEDSVTVTNGDLFIGAGRLGTAVLDPVADGDMVNKSYVDLSVENAEAGAFEVIDALVDDVVPATVNIFGNFFDLFMTTERTVDNSGPDPVVDVLVGIDFDFTDGRYLFPATGDGRFINIGGDDPGEADRLLRDINEGDALYAQPSDIDGAFMRLDGGRMSTALPFADSVIDGPNRIDIKDPGVNEGLCWPTSEASWCIDVAAANHQGNGGNELHLYGTDAGNHNIVAWRPLKVRGGLLARGYTFPAPNDETTTIFAWQGNCPSGSRSIANHNVSGIQRRLCARVE